MIRPRSRNYPTTVESSEEQTVAEAVGSNREALDCGCGKGRVAAALFARGCVVDGIELSPEAARVSRPSCRTLVQGSLTDPATWEQLGGMKYDAIVFCHVLEHLVEPLSVLEAAGRHLAAGGHFVIALPNVATWRMRLHLLRGRWDYADEGVLDRTHVCFYTLESARALLTAAGLTIKSERLLRRPASGSSFRRGLVGAVRGLIPLASTEAFLFTASPA